MSAHDPAVADFRSETYPEFTGDISDNYVEATFLTLCPLLTLPEHHLNVGWYGTSDGNSAACRHHRVGLGCHG